jgi:hypothetical protein
MKMVIIRWADIRLPHRMWNATLPCICPFFLSRQELAALSFVGIRQNTERNVEKTSIFLLIILFTFLAARPLLAANLDHSERYGHAAPRDFPGKTIGGRPSSLPAIEKNPGHRENHATVELIADRGSNKLSFSYHGLDFSRTILADGGTFSYHEEVLSGLDHDVYNFIYQYHLVNLGNPLAGVSLGIIGQVKLMEGQTDLLAPGQRRKEIESIPLIGLNLQMGIFGDLVEGRLRATGSGYGHGNIFDGQAEFSVYPYPFLDIYGGYRFYFIDIEGDDAKLCYDQSGPYLGITLSF